MYAVIETGGKQYKVAVGDKLKVEKLAAAEGASVELGRVLMVADGERITAGSSAPQTAVSATVLGHGRGERIRVFKMKRRKNYRRTQGHRQSYTEIEITAIGGGKTVVKTGAKAEVKTGATTETKTGATSGSKTGAKAEATPEAKTAKKSATTETSTGKSIAAKKKTAAKTEAKAGAKTGKKNAMAETSAGKSAVAKKQSAQPAKKETD